MTIADRIIEAQQEAGPDLRDMVIYLAAVVEGLRTGAQDAMSHGYLRMAPNVTPAPVESPEQLLEAFELIAGIDDGADL